MSDDHELPAPAPRHYIILHVDVVRVDEPAPPCARHCPPTGRLFTDGTRTWASRRFWRCCRQTWCTVDCLRSHLEAGGGERLTDDDFAYAE